MADQHTPAALRKCNKCGVVKEEATAFRKCNLQSRFYTCKACCDQKSSERRRRDPAARIAARLRSRGYKDVDVRVIRRILDTSPSEVVANDRVDVVRLRPDEPLTPGNAVVCVKTPVGRLVVPAG